MRRLLPLAVVAVVVLGAISLASHLDETDATASAQGATFANKGRPVEAAADAAEVLERFGHDGLYLLATRGDHAYYTVGDRRGRHCYAVGPAAEIGRLHGLSCRGVRAPLLDSVLFEATRDDPELRVYAAEGIAADGIARVELLAPDGTVVASADVDDNVFRFDDIPKTPLTSIAAVDASGRRVYSRSLLHEPQRQG